MGASTRPQLPKASGAPCPPKTSKPKTSNPCSKKKTTQQEMMGVGFRAQTGSMLLTPRALRSQGAAIRVLRASGFGFRV